ncbi:MC136 [Molluscum contagiosum virus subtype 2]|uniref:MC136 n=2 Tax=Molluscum contagiosum virus TaxID=10279 RepID=A0A1S7DLW7_MCV2|nr:MC136 [Molluscum contagiosum virus subtype 2]QHW16524.1 MC136L [Molluscum contagiosum virus]AYO87771.1 MC136 [Molluscum contagiosum virus subtype 2]AYO87941.1 MC136 [Molluscum contagiosum virus subtype 2]AYO88111.1 MC136 [Molluscum contagiosum virus subtype 2]
MEDVDEANLLHLLERLAGGGDEFGATLAAIRELISAINSKVLTLNKKSKKSARAGEHVPRRENASH